LRCAKTDRELRPGEKFFSVLYDRGHELVREDISAEAWQGPPPEAFSFWMGRVPAKEKTKRLDIDDELLLDLFQRLAEAAEPRKANFRYIVALLLMRRKRLRFEEVAFEHGQEFLVLRCTKTRAAHRVVNPQLTDEQTAEVEEEVYRVLGLN
jgi:hypothetical protein